MNKYYNWSSSNKFSTKCLFNQPSFDQLSKFIAIFGETTLSFFFINKKENDVISDQDQGKYLYHPFSLKVFLLVYSTLEPPCGKHVFNRNNRKAPLVLKIRVKMQNARFCISNFYQRLSS